MKEILYLPNDAIKEAIITNPKINEKISDLMNERTRGKLLKNFPDYSLSRVKINYSDRLLFARTSINKIRYLIPLSIIFGHEYDKEKLMIDNYFIATMTKIISTINQSQVQDFSFLIETKKENSYHDNIILLDDNENKINNTFVINETKLNKNYILSWINEQIHDACNTNYPVIYLANSYDNAVEIQNGFGKYQTPIKVLTYPDFIQEFNFLNEKSIIDSDFFKTWLEKFSVKSIRNFTYEKGAFPKELFDNEETIYQEFRIISGYKDKDYLTAGSKKTLFKSLNERNILLDAYNSYLSDLSEEDKIDLSFYSFAPQIVCPTIIVETSYLSCLQLKQLLDCAQDSRLVLLTNDHHNLWDITTFGDFFNHAQEIDIQGDNQELFDLSPHTGGGVEFANAIFDLKQYLTGTTGKFTDSNHHAPKEYTGNVTWFKNTLNEDFRLLLNSVNSNNIVVMTYNEYLPEAHEFFNTQQILSFDQVLEKKFQPYETVIFYQPFNKPIFGKANAKLNQQEIKGNYNASFVYAFNLLYEASLNANNLIIVQDNENSFNLNIIINFLQQSPKKTNIKEWIDSYHIEKRKNNIIDYSEGQKDNNDKPKKEKTKRKNNMGNYNPTEVLSNTPQQEKSSIPLTPKLPRNESNEEELYLADFAIKIQRVCNALSQKSYLGKAEKNTINTIYLDFMLDKISKWPSSLKEYAYGVLPQVIGTYNSEIIAYAFCFEMLSSKKFKPQYIDVTRIIQVPYVKKDGSSDFSYVVSINDYYYLEFGFIANIPTMYCETREIEESYNIKVAECKIVYQLSNIDNIERLLLQVNKKCTELFNEFFVLENKPSFYVSLDRLKDSKAVHAKAFYCDSQYSSIFENPKLTSKLIEQLETTGILLLEGLYKCGHDFDEMVTRINTKKYKWDNFLFYLDARRLEKKDPDKANSQFKKLDEIIKKKKNKTSFDEWFCQWWQNKTSTMASLIQNMNSPVFTTHLVSDVKEPDTSLNEGKKENRLA